MSLFHLFLFGGDTKTSENICCNFIAIEDYVVTIRFYGSFHSESKIHSIHKVTILLLITNLIKYETFHLKGIQHEAASLNLSNIFNNYPIDSHSPVSLPLSLSFFFFFEEQLKLFLCNYSHLSSSRIQTIKIMIVELRKFYGNLWSRRKNNFF